MRWSVTYMAKYSEPWCADECTWVEYGYVAESADLGSLIKCFEADAEGDGSFCRVRVVTTKEAKRQQEDARYRRMEAAVQEFAASRGVGLGSKAFLLAIRDAVRGVKEERERWDDHETRMEEWANHMHSWSRDAYFDDFNFENGRYDSRTATLSEVWAYVQKKFPLMALKVAEAKESKRASRPTNQG
jgi:hypothetical protein